MKTLFCFMKKEWLEYSRSRKLLIIFGMAILFGIMNPAMGKLTPWLLENLNTEGIEIIIDKSAINANMSWQQFYKNMPMFIVVFILVFCGNFTNEYQNKTLIPIITKGLDRWKVVIGKACSLCILWTGSFYLTYALTYFYTDYYWDNSIMTNLGLASVFYWIYGLLMIWLLVFFSCISNSTGNVLLGVGGVYFVCMLVGMFGKIKNYLPTYLCDAGITKGGSISGSIGAVIVSIGVIIFCIVFSVTIFNKKQF